MVVFADTDSSEVFISLQLNKICAFLEKCSWVMSSATSSTHQEDYSPWQEKTNAVRCQIVVFSDYEYNKFTIEENFRNCNDYLCSIRCLSNYQLKFIYHMYFRRPTYFLSQLPLPHTNLSPSSLADENLYGSLSKCKLLNMTTTVCA